MYNVVIYGFHTRQTSPHKWARGSTVDYVSFICDYYLICENDDMVCMAYAWNTNRRSLFIQNCLIEGVVCLTCICVVIVVSNGCKIIRFDYNFSSVHGNRSSVGEWGSHVDACCSELIDNLWKGEINIWTKIWCILSGCRVSETHIKITLVIFVKCCDVSGLLELLVIADVDREGERVNRGYEVKNKEYKCHIFHC